MVPFCQTTGELVAWKFLSDLNFCLNSLLDGHDDGSNSHLKEPFLD